MLDRMEYIFVYRIDAASEPRIVRHETRAGDAENTARRIARMLAKKHRASEVICIYKGPAGAGIPDDIRGEEWSE